MEWISCKDEHPKYNEFVLFCLNTALKTVYLGWRENKINIKDNEDMWFAEGFGYWFTENEVLGWCRFPNTDGLLTSSSSRNQEMANQGFNRTSRLS